MSCYPRCVACRHTRSQASHTHTPTNSLSPPCHSHRCHPVLSQMGMYYELKFLVICWLMFYQGADKIYRGVRQTLKKLSRSIPFLMPEKKNMVSEKAFRKQLPAPMRAAVRKRGLRAVFEELTCDEDVTRLYGPAPLVQVKEEQARAAHSAGPAAAARLSHTHTPFSLPVIYSSGIYGTRSTRDT